MSCVVAVRVELDAAPPSERESVCELVLPRHALLLELAGACGNAWASGWGLRVGVRK